MSRGDLLEGEQDLLVGEPTSQSACVSGIRHDRAPRAYLIRSRQMAESSMCRTPT